VIGQEEVSDATWIAVILVLRASRATGPSHATHALPPFASPGQEKPTPATTGSGRRLPPGFVHLGAIKEIAPILREFGLDPDPLIRDAGLDPSLFDDGANMIPGAALDRLLTLGVARTHCPHLGLLSAGGRRSCRLASWGA